MFRCALARKFDVARLHQSLNTHFALFAVMMTTVGYRQKICVYCDTGLRSRAYVSFKRHTVFCT